MRIVNWIVNQIGFLFYEPPYRVAFIPLIYFTLDIAEKGYTREDFEKMLNSDSQLFACFHPAPKWILLAV